MAIQSLRIHVTITNRGQGLDAEEESLQERAGSHLGNARPTDSVERGKDEIDDDIDRQDKGGESWPI